MPAPSSASTYGRMSSRRSSSIAFTDSPSSHGIATVIPIAAHASTSEKLRLRL